MHYLWNLNSSHGTRPSLKVHIQELNIRTDFCDDNGNLEGPLRDAVIFDYTGQSDSVGVKSTLWPLLLSNDYTCAISFRTNWF